MVNSLSINSQEFFSEELHEECGVFGIYGNDGISPAYTCYNGLLALQHRGQESCGISVNDRGVISSYKNMGLVSEVFNDKEILNGLNGQMAIAHVRYSTAGGSVRENSQPLVMRYIKGTLAIAHNGNLTNAYEVRKELEQRGAIFQTTIDSEAIAYLIARERVNAGSVEEAVEKAVLQIEGAYSLLVMSPQKIIAVRDPNGFRPLCIGKIGNNIIFSSETSALAAIGAEFVRDVEPGEIVVADEDGLRSIRTRCNSRKKSLCVFEYIYFARTDSVIDGVSVYESRKEAGRILARSFPVEADIVIGVPESGIDAALGYSEESGIPYEKGIVKNSYIGRTFIKPTQKERANNVRLKLNPLGSVLKGKRVVVIDDSIVRGTTCDRIVRMLREAGATEVHLRISSPPFVWPCFYGVDIPSRDELIAVKHTLDEICELTGADSLGFFPPDKLNELLIGKDFDICDACFSGSYPTKIPEKMLSGKERGGVDFSKKIKKNV